MNGRHEDGLPDAVVDGVDVFWVDDRRPNLTARLTFRCGVVDETPQTSGWSHLTEHLALYGRGSSGVQVNGRTGLFHTRIELQGRPEAVGRTLTSITAWLAEPDLSRLGTESAVLQAEARVRRTSPLEWVLGARYGLTGPGLIGLSELGLLDARPELLHGWLAERFTRENAVLALDGPVPAGLRLALPPGRRRPVPPAVPLWTGRPMGLRTPAPVIVGSAPAVATAATAALARVAGRVLTEELRDSTGQAYAPAAALQDVDGERAELCLWSDVAPGSGPDATERWFAALRRITEERYDAGWLAEMVDQTAASLRDPHLAFDQLSRRAERHLDGRSPIGDEERLADLAALRPTDLTREMLSWQTDHLLGLPDGAPWPAGLGELTAPVADHDPDARTFRTRLRQRRFLHIGAKTVQAGTDDPLPTIAIEQAAALVRTPDGGRLLIDRAGWRIVIEPTMWAFGARAVRAVDDLVPRSLWISGPEREPADIPRPPRFGNRARVADLVVGFVVAAMLSGFAILDGHLAVGLICFVLMLATCVGYAAITDRLPDRSARRPAVARGRATR